VSFGRREGFGEGCLRFARPGVGRLGRTVKYVDSWFSYIHFLFLLLGILGQLGSMTRQQRKGAEQGEPEFWFLVLVCDAAKGKS
jgi:hypothetical protein